MRSIQSLFKSLEGEAPKDVFRERAPRIKVIPEIQVYIVIDKKEHCHFKIQDISISGAALVATADNLEINEIYNGKLFFDNENYLVTFEVVRSNNNIWEFAGLIVLKLLISC